MTQAKGASARFSYVAEVTRNTTPGTPSMKKLAAAVYGETLGPKIGNVMSRAIRGTRGRSVPRAGEIRVDGTVPFELAPLGLASLLKQALGSAANPSGSDPYTHVIKRGALPAGITIEKGFTDLGRYFVHTGCLVNGMSLNISAEDSLVTGAFDFIGMGHSTSGSSLGSPSSVVHNPFTEFECEIEEGGSAVTLLNFAMQYQNEVERVGAIGTRYAVGLNEGEGTLDYTATLMFENMTHVDKWLNETVTSMQVTMSDGTSSIAMLLPKAKYFGDSAPKIATPQGIVVELSGMAYYDTSEATDLKITVVNSEATI